MAKIPGLSNFTLSLISSANGTSPQIDSPPAPVRRDLRPDHEVLDHPVKDRYPSIISLFQTSPIKFSQASGAISAKKAYLYISHVGLNTTG